MTPTSRDHPSFSAVILAGGYATRFGEDDKAVADLAGKPMIRRVVERLSVSVDTIVVNCRAEQQSPIESALESLSGDPTVTIEFAFDPVPDQGPVGGIKTGLEAVSNEYAAVVACDMPFCSPALLEELAARAAGHNGAVVRLEDGWYQPTHAVYRAQPMATACSAVLESDDKRIVRALEAIDCIVVEESDLETPVGTAFESIDTKEALLKAERRLTSE
ncbi:molybdenum cofactor guanylyltransferase [Natrialbaceae archaeon A-chndr2]